MIEKAIKTQELFASLKYLTFTLKIARGDPFPNKTIMPCNEQLPSDF